MVSKRYDSGDWRRTDGLDDAGKVEISDDIQKVKRLDAFLEGLEPEISPLEKLKQAVKSNIISSFRLTSMVEINEKWGKGCCECCDEQVGEEGFSGHKCKETDCTFLILNVGWEDELVAFVYHEVKKKDKQEDQLIDLEEKTKNKEIAGGNENRYGGRVEPRKEGAKSDGIKVALRRLFGNHRWNRRKTKKGHHERGKVKKEEQKKKKRCWMDSGEPEVENCGGSKDDIKGERKNLSYVCCGSGGGPGKTAANAAVGSANPVSKGKVVLGFIEKVEMRRKGKKEGGGCGVAEEETAGIFSVMVDGTGGGGG